MASVGVSEREIDQAGNVKGNVPDLCFCSVLCVYRVLAYIVLCAVYGANNTLNVKGNVPALCFRCVLWIVHCVFCSIVLM